MGGGLTLIFIEVFFGVAIIIGVVYYPWWV